MTKLTLESDGRKLSFESEDEDVFFDDVLEGFLGCMFGLGYVPGTEISSFTRYIHGMESLYAKKDSENCE